MARVGIRKFIIPAILGLAALAVAGAVYLRSLDFTQYKDGLVHELRVATGRDVAIDGSISLVYGFEPAFVIQGVRIGNAPWGTRADMAQVDRVTARIDLAALLRGRLNFDQLRLTQANVWLETDPYGKVNWVLAGDPMTAGSSPAGVVDASNLLERLMVGRIEIDGGRMTIRDGKTGDVRVLAISTARSSGDGVSGPISIQLDGRWNGVPVTLDGSAGPAEAGSGANETAYPVDVSGAAGALRLSAKGHIEQSPRGSGIIAKVSATLGKPADNVAGVSLQGDLAYRGERVMVSNLRIAAGEAEAAGTVTVDLSGDAATFDADIKAPSINAGPFWDALRGGAVSDLAILGVSPGALAAVNGRIGLSIDSLSVGPATLHNVVSNILLKDKVLSSERVSGRFADNTLAGSFKLDLRAPVPAFAMSMKAPGFNAGPLLQQLASIESFDGLVAVSAQISSTGSTSDEWIAGLQGEILLAMGRGRLRIADPANGHFDVGTSGPSMLAGMLVGREGGDTGIRCAASRIILQEGLAQSIGTEIHSDAAHVRGEGIIDFQDGLYALRFVPASRGPELAVPTPVSIGGRLAEPKLSTDPVAGNRRLSIGGGLSPLRRWFEGVVRKSTANDCLKAIPRSPEKRRTVKRKPRPRSQPARMARPIIAENPAARAPVKSPETIEEPASAE